MTHDNASAAATAMLHLATGVWMSQAIYAAAKLGLADLLRNGPLLCRTLAAATNTNPGALYRLLRALASADIFAEEDDAVFRLTPRAECLLSGVPGSLRAFAIMLGEEEHWQSWGKVLYSVETGQPAFDHVFGMPQFSYFAAHPRAARVFDEAMTSRSGQENEAIIAAYDFSKFQCVVDVGGGEGTLLRLLLKVTPTVRAVLFDMPHVIESARAAWGRDATRIEFKHGNFFDKVPTGGDAYILKRVIHDWDDERALTILKNCRKAMHPGARLFLIEPIIPPGNCASFNKLLDLLMLVWTSGGKERTAAEHSALLVAAGFELVHLVPTNSYLGIIEATPEQ